MIDVAHHQCIDNRVHGRRQGAGDARFTGAFHGKRIVRARHAVMHRARSFLWLDERRIRPAIEMQILAGHEASECAA